MCLPSKDTQDHIYFRKNGWSLHPSEQDGPSSGVKLDLKRVLEKTLPPSRPSELLTQAPLATFKSWHPWHLFNPSTFSNSSTLYSWYFFHPLLMRIGINSWVYPNYEWTFLTFGTSETLGTFGNHRTFEFQDQGHDLRHCNSLGLGVVVGVFGL